MSRQQKKIFLILFLLFMAISLVACANENNKQVQSIQVQPTNFQPNQNNCTECHEMRPEVLTWQTSAHNKFDCTTCHDVKPDDYKAQQQNQSFSKPIVIKDSIPDSICLDCHSNNRVTSASGDLIIPHKKHADAKVSCVTCHSGVVHGNIAKRGITAEGELSDFKAWNLDVTKKVVTSYFRKPNMWTCIECHKQIDITRKCGACHTSIPELPSHDKPTWMEDHGQMARKRIDECTKCHTSTGEPVEINPAAKDKAVEFARTQEFCYKCHLQRPKMHEESMLEIHPEKVVTRGEQNCLTCHEREQPKPNTNAKIIGTYCNQCHWNKK